MSTFPIFDAEHKLYQHSGDGITTPMTDRDVLADLGSIIPVDARDDEFYEIPMRSVFHSGAGPTFELGPFSLDEDATLLLMGALVAHCRSFPSTFKVNAPGGVA